MSIFTTKHVFKVVFHANGSRDYCAHLQKFSVFMLQNKILENKKNVKKIVYSYASLLFLIYSKLILFLRLYIAF